MKLTQSFTSSCAVILGTLGSLSTATNAATIIEDSFSRNGPLDGSTPDIGQSWEATGWNTTGSELSITASTRARMTGISLLPETAYTLSMDFNVTSGFTFWISFGFNTTDLGGMGGVGTILHRQAPEVQLFDQSGPPQSVNVASGFPKTLSVQLETGATLANSTLTWLVDGSQVGNSRPANASNVNGIFIQNNQASGLMDNLSLTSAPIPEPSSTLLLSLSLAGLLCGRRRR